MVIRQSFVDATDNDVIEVGEADVVGSDDAFIEVSAVNARPSVVVKASESDAVLASLPAVSASDSECGQPKLSFTPLLAALTGAAVALLLVVIAGLGWWVISRIGSSHSEEAIADLGAIESTEMPWDVADANRHLRHNKEPIKLPSKASKGTEKPSTNTSQTFQRESTEAEVRAKIETGKKPSTASSPAPEKTPEHDRSRVIEDLKSVTVYIRVETSEGVQSGSGFLFQRHNNWGTIVTNAHVIEPEEGKIEKIDCVFFSGTNREFEVTARVSCKDKLSDLAFLTAYDEKIPPPIHAPKDVSVYETSTVLAAGFPFGEVLKTNRRNPSITITKGTVSSLRLDDYDMVSVLQIDGGINPGNSGGPVVLEDGRLVGVAVAKVRGTSIGFAIPTQILQQTALGRIKSITVQKTDQERGQHQFKIRFVDPNRQVKSGELIVFRRSDQTVDRPTSDGSWRPAAEKLLVSHPLRVETFTLIGESSLVAELEIPAEANLMFQVRIRRRGGGEHWSQPSKLPHSLELGVATRVPLSGVKDEPEVVERNRKPTIAVLPTIMSDFALNPSTGDIACLDPIQHQVQLIRADGLKSSDYSSSPKTSIGKGPVSVAYKRYQEHDYFVAACSQKSELYLLTADSLELVETIPVAGSHISRVMVSTNQDDPFVYYNYGAGDDSRTGAIDLRLMTDCGEVFDDSMDCTISADGRFAYRRSPPSSLEIQSLRMVGDFSAQVPNFVPVVRGHRAAGQCVPGPFGQITALDTRIYSVDLVKQLATMDFTPACIFRTRPVIVGLSGRQLVSRGKLILRAASLNTFSSVNATVDVPPELVHLATVPQQTRSQQPAANQVFLGAKLFADDLNAQVVYASLDKIALIPLDGFGLRNDEPLMNLTSSSADVQVGEESKIELQTTQPHVSIKVGEMPVGMKQVVGGLNWRPQDEDVGTTVIPITLTFDDIERIVDFQVHVRQPSIQTLIDVADFLVDPKLAFYVCWSGQTDVVGRSVKHAGNDARNGSQLCVIPLDEGYNAIQKKLPFVIRQAALLGSRVALLPEDENQQIHILSLKTLEREQLLLSSLPVQTIEVQGTEFLLHGDKSVDVYSVESMKRLRSYDRQAPPSPPREPSPRVLVDGVLSDGVLCRRSDFEPILIIAPGKMPTLPGFQASLMDGHFLRQVFSSHDASSGRNGLQSSNLVLEAPIAIPESSLQVSLENRMMVTQVPGEDLQPTEQRVNLLVAETDRPVAARVPIVRELMIPGVSPGRPVMRVAGGNVMVSCGSRIYRMSTSSLRRHAVENPSDSGDSQSDELHFVPQQSASIVADNTISLSHQVAGGSPPYDLFLMNRSGGIELNDETGEVTLSRDGLLQSAATVLATRVAGMNDDEVAQELKNLSLDLGEAFERFTGSTLNGFPIAVPIHLKASDSDGTIAEIQYFVFTDISIEEAIATISTGQSDD